MWYNVFFYNGSLKYAKTWYSKQKNFNFTMYIAQ